jgi:hypothetical protein
MNFSDLTFVDHPVIAGATQTVQVFPNGWQVSIVAGPPVGGGLRLAGTIGEDTFEVAVINPRGGMLEDILPWQTPVQITTILRLVEML